MRHLLAKKSRVQSATFSKPKLNQVENRFQMPRKKHFRRENETTSKDTSPIFFRDSQNEPELKSQPFSSQSWPPRDFAIYQTKIFFCASGQQSGTLDALSQGNVVGKAERTPRSLVGGFLGDVGWRLRPAVNGRAIPRLDPSHRGVLRSSDKPWLEPSPPPRSRSVTHSCGTKIGWIMRAGCSTLKSYQDFRFGFKNCSG